MNYAIWICCFLPLIIALFEEEKQKKAIIKQHINSKNKENKLMIELVKRYINKDCLIKTINGQFSGIIKEVTNGAIVIENDKSLEVINLDYVISVREYPLNKNGKRKTVFIG